MRPDHSPIVAVNLRCTADFRDDDLKIAGEHVAQRVIVQRAWLVAQPKAKVLHFGGANKARG